MKKKAAQSFHMSEFFFPFSVSKDIPLFWETILMQMAIFWEGSRELIVDTASSISRFACVQNKPVLEHEMMIFF